MRFTVAPRGLHRLTDVDRDMCARLDDAINLAMTRSAPLLTDYFKWILGQGYDVETYAALQREWIQSQYMTDAKFLAFTWYSGQKFTQLIRLGFHQREPMRVLDLGCGAGHAALVARFLGHDFMGLDAPNRPLFDALCKFWRVPKMAHWIRRQEPMPKPVAKYDMVTAFLSQFDVNPWMSDQERWSIEDWEFFLHDVRWHQLREGGKLYINLTNDPRRDYRVSQHLRKRASVMHEKNKLEFF